MRKKLETLLTALFPGWALHRLAARNREREKRKKKKSTGRMFAGRNVVENERRRYSDPWEA